jgi:micrococcal nuclease
MDNQPSRKRAFFSCIFLVLTLSALALAPLKSPSRTPSTLPLVEAPDPSALESGEVVRIIDGDTLLIKVADRTRRYQLLGSDAPEFNPKDRNPDLLGVRARRFIEQLLLNEQVYIQPDPHSSRDKANRLTAYLFRAPDMLFVNLELVRQGYAKSSTRNQSLYLDAFAAYETRSKELERGIWNPNPTAIPSGEPEVIPEESIDQSPPPSSVDQDNAIDGPNTEQSSVYITKYGKKYHTKDCPHLTESQREIERDDLADTYKPCKTCKPDE